MTRNTEVPAGLLLAAVRTAPAVGRYDISAERGWLSRQIFRLQHRERFIALGA